MRSVKDPLTQRLVEDRLLHGPPGFTLALRDRPPTRLPAAPDGPPIGPWPLTFDLSRGSLASGSYTPDI